MRTNATLDTLQQALAETNKKYCGNLAFNRLEQDGGRVNFTLRVNSSKGPGARRGFTGRRMAKACWHAHGDFFATVLRLDPAARIASNGSVITAQGGNWQDKNIGSMMQPLMFSEACDCDKENRG